MASTGMITRHFDHPSGATATLEFPAGYGNRTYYKLTIRNADGSEAVPPETKQYNNSHEARVGAVEREREAMRNGWRPRMAAIDPGNRPTMTLYREDGRPLGCRVIGWVRTTDRGLQLAYQHGVRLQDHYYEIDTEFVSAGNTPNAGDTLIVRVGENVVETYFKLMVQAAEYEEGGAMLPRLIVNGVVVPSDTTSLPALVANAAMRETLIANYDDVEHLPSYSILWVELSTAVPDASARATLVQEIISRRHERDRAAQLQRERAAIEAAGEALRVERLPARRGSRTTAITATTTGPASTPPPGADLSKPKQRKIKLGD